MLRQVVAHNGVKSVFVMLPINAKAMLAKKTATAMVKVRKDLPLVCAKAAISHLFHLPDR